MPWVCELNYYDPTLTIETFIRFSLGPGVSPVDAPYIAPGLQKWAAPTQKISIDVNGIISSSDDQGEVDITNLPNDITQAGPFDNLINMIFQGRAANLYWLPENAAWADAVLTDTQMLEQPIINLTLGTSVTAYMAFTLRDPRSVLTGNIQPVQYAGTNVGPLGVEGTPTDLQGKPKPILYGRASNIPGIQVNQSQLIYQIADKTAFVDCVRDGGVALTPGTLRASLASLQVNTPAPGTYDYSNSYLEGTYVKLGSTPQFTVTFDAYEGSPVSQRTHAQIWKRFRIDRCFTDVTLIDNATVMAADTLDSGEAGFWWGDSDAVQLDSLDTILQGFSGFENLSAAGMWQIQKLTIPPSGATTVFDIGMLTPGSFETLKFRRLTSIGFVRPDYSPDGAPPYQVTVQWGQCYQVMGDSDFAGAAPQRLHDKFSQQWRSTVSSNLANWNPATNTGPWKYAPSFTMSSGYAVGPDGLTCPPASAEAIRLLAMFGVQRLQSQLTFAGEPGDVLNLGDVAGLTFPSYGLGAGVLFRVLQTGTMVDVNGYQIAAILGLQRLASDP